MKSWIYKVVEFNHTGVMSSKFDCRAIEEKLNELGGQGWEFCGVHTTSNGGYSDRVVYTLKKETI